MGRLGTGLDRTRRTWLPLGALLVVLATIPFFATEMYDSEDFAPLVPAALLAGLVMVAGYAAGRPVLRDPARDRALAWSFYACMSPLSWIVALAFVANNAVHSPVVLVFVGVPVLAAGFVLVAARGRPWERWAYLASPLGVLFLLALWALVVAPISAYASGYLLIMVFVPMYVHAMFRVGWPERVGLPAVARTATVDPWAGLRHP